MTHTRGDLLRALSKKLIQLSRNGINCGISPQTLKVLPESLLLICTEQINGSQEVQDYMDDGAGRLPYG